MTGDGCGVVGAGDGTYAIALARRLEPMGGHVYATELDPERLAARQLTINHVRFALRGQNKDTSGGDFWEGNILRDEEGDLIVLDWNLRRRPEPPP
jgi:protein gp37